MGKLDQNGLFLPNWFSLANGRTVLSGGEGKWNQELLLLNVTL